MNIFDTPFPADSETLLQELEQAYPDRSPSLVDTDREVWFKAGRRDLINFLRRWKTASDEKGPLRNVSSPDPKGRPRRYSSGG